MLMYRVLRFVPPVSRRQATLSDEAGNDGPHGEPRFAPGLELEVEAYGVFLDGEVVLAEVGGLVEDLAEAETNAEAGEDAFIDADVVVVNRLRQTAVGESRILAPAIWRRKRRCADSTD